jgi:hypothetical protein
MHSKVLSWESQHAGIPIHLWDSRKDSVGIHRIPAELPHSSKLESRNPEVLPPKGFRLSFHARATRRSPDRPGGPPALRPHHSPDKDTPSYYTKNGSSASGVSKMWCVSTFTSRGLFIGPWGSSTDLAKAVTHQVAAGRLRHVS